MSVLLASSATVRGVESGAVRRAWLGVSMADMSASMQKMIGRDFKVGGDAGVRVAQVAANGPAAQAGLKQGDIILRVGATRMTSGRQVVTMVSRLRPGQTIDVTFLREVTVRKTRIVLGAIDADGRRSLVEPEAEGASNPTEALFDAAARGDAAKVVALIQAGADVRATNANGQVPLHVACGAGHTRVAKLLIDADHARGETERGDTLIMNFDEYVNRTSPTLTARDRNGNTPLHAAAQNGHVAAAKLLIDNGADKSVKNREGRTAGEVAAQRGAAGVLGDELYAYEPPSLEPPVTVTRYAPKLRELVARVQEIQRRFAQARSRRLPQADLLTLGQQLLLVGTDLEKLLDGSSAKVTRFGTFEEAGLIAALKEAHGQAASTLQMLALVKVASESESNSAARGRNPNQMQQILRTAGRVVIEEEATEWMRKNGLEALLVENGYNAMRGEVTQGIELNLRTFLDKKSTELLGMPLGGFRSMQAAFRLQARRAVRETVAELLLNFSGNQLVVCLLQRHIVHWVEADLWPQLREAFRPKTHLDRRVRISMGTMEQASEDLNRLVEGRDPTYVLIGDVMKAVERAEGKIQATRYLKRDLQRAQKQELMDDLLAAENILQRDIRRIRHQFLVGDDERWKEMGDNLEYVWGMHASVGTIVQGIPEEKRRIEAAIQRFFQAMMREDTAAVMTLIHEQSPVHSSEAAARLRQYFASHIMQGGGLVVSKIIKESDQDADVTIFDKAEGSGQSVSLVFRRSGETWKLYGPGDGS